MSWSASGNTVEDVREFFESNYPDASDKAKEQFAASLECVGGLVDVTGNDGDSVTVSTSISAGSRRIQLSGHVTP